MRSPQQPQRAKSVCWPSGVYEGVMRTIPATRSPWAGVFEGVSEIAKRVAFPLALAAIVSFSSGGHFVTSVRYKLYMNFDLPDDHELIRRTVRDFAEQLPGRMNRILDALAANDLRLKIEVIDHGSIIDGFQKVANRITTGLILAALIIGAADYTVTLGGFTLNGITLGTFGAILLYQIFKGAPDTDDFAIVGDAANFVNSMRLKGIHLAMRSGMLAAEAAFAPLLSFRMSTPRAASAGASSGDLAAVRAWRAASAGGGPAG